MNRRDIPHKQHLSVNKAMCIHLRTYMSIRTYMKASVHPSHADIQTELHADCLIQVCMTECTNSSVRLASVTSSWRLYSRKGKCRHRPRYQHKHACQYVATCLHACMHICTHTYIHTYVSEYIYPSIHTYIHTDRLASRQTQKQTHIHNYFM